MRIAYCTESLPPLVDGVTRTLSELVATLRETGHEFTFLSAVKPDPGLLWRDRVHTVPSVPFPLRSEEHTSELQSHHDLVCRLLLEKKKTTNYISSSRRHPATDRA